MELLGLIISGVALLGVGVSLVGFLQKVPDSERLAVIALICVGGLLLIVIALDAQRAASGGAAKNELCDGVNNNREAIAALALQKQPPATAQRVEELIDGPVC